MVRGKEKLVCSLIRLGSECGTIGHPLIRLLAPGCGHRPGPAWFVSNMGVQDAETYPEGY
jgi:hypothetical protein